MTYDELVRLGLEMPDVEESMYYGTPALKRAGRFMLGLKKEGDLVSVKVDWDSHDRLLAEHAHVLFKTPHYEGWPGFLVRLDLLEEALAKELVALSWGDAPFPSKRRR